MPLDRDHITAASRIMLPTYVGLFAGLGIGLLATPMGRLLEAPFFRYANHLMTLRAWGVLFLLCATLMVFALVRQRRMLYRWSLLVCGLAMATWAIVAVVGIWFQPISFTAWLWPGFVMVCTFATDTSLKRGEQDRRTEH